MKMLAATAMLLMAVVPAHAMDCAGISDPAKRLRCYDEGATKPQAISEWTFDAKARRISSCGTTQGSKGKACLAFACDYKSPTMTFFGQRLPPAVSAETGDGTRIPLPRTGTQEEKTFAREFGMEARTFVLDGDEHLASLFNGMGGKPIVVRAADQAWSFATEPARSASAVSGFREACVGP